MRVINVLKPQGWTSFDVVRFIKRRFNEKKVGHLGTLDPMATGVLPVFLGQATRLIPIFEDSDKTYQAVCKLGERTDTFDAEGEVVETKDFSHLDSDEIILKACNSFKGKQEQFAPVFSALKIKGVPSYKLAREGKEPERKKRTVMIHELDVLSVDVPLVTMKIRCSKGTYIRTIADDLGHKLGVGAHLIALERIACGNLFTTENAVSLDQLRNEKDSDIIPWLAPSKLLDHLKTVNATSEMAIQLGYGKRILIQKVPNNDADRNIKTDNALTESSNDELIKVLDNDHNLIAIGKFLWENGVCYLKPDRVFVKENKKIIC